MDVLVAVDVEVDVKVTMEIWISLTSTKSTSALFLLDQEGQDYTVRRYLDDPPSLGEIRDLLCRLAMEPWDLVRFQEPVAEALGLASWERTPAARDRWTTALVRNPVLIQRPIIIADDGTAVVARTRQAVRSVLVLSSQPSYSFSSSA